MQIFFSGRLRNGQSIIKRGTSLFLAVGKWLALTRQHADRSRFDAFAGHNDVFDVAFFQASGTPGAVLANRLALILDLGDMPAIALALAKSLAVVIDGIRFGRFFDSFGLGRTAGRGKRISH